MRTKLGLCLLSAALLCSTPGWSEERAADHEALRAALKTATTAINNRDVQALTGCLAREFVFTSIDQTVFTNATDFAAYFARMFTAPDAPLASLRIAPQATILTRFVGPDVGYCYGTSVDRYTLKDGKVFTLDVRWTALVVRENGQWKAATVHCGVNFLDNPVLKAAGMSFWKKLGVLLHLAKPPYEVAK